MVGFTPHLSTQDPMLQLKHQVLDHKSRPTCANLGLDPKKASDNAAHSMILARIFSLNMGERADNYATNFLLNKKMRITIADVKSDLYELGSNGTSQDSVIYLVYAFQFHNGMSTTRTRKFWVFITPSSQILPPG